MAELGKYNVEDRAQEEPHEDVSNEGGQEESEEAKNENAGVRSGSATPVERPWDKDKERERDRPKMPVKYIENKTRRHVTFAKRRLGIMKKAYELSVLTGANVLLLILSRTGLVYTFTTPKLEPIVRDLEGKTLIRACLSGTSTEPTPTASMSAASTPNQQVGAST
ncbi:hypothetical protein HG535_0C01180 [Zygotorulaspora mrakii]|uniref:MADS-box domain-containing protein n=1 Tax=Zygotorulaspora mrakii TaxID=42260 RepID=A0A7H9B1C8_ZYGMR|nr:uncharacterized protein HG535_0C01180 [Zygotorulaspora mrakii]QLG71769.1 hypothetical protein HG535_0C01180 [Zygotorulaspora mrakii]